MTESGTGSEHVEMEVHEAGHAPSLSAHIFTHIGPFPITDAYIGTLIIVVMMTATAIAARRTFGIIPSRMQLFFETAVNFVLGEMEDAFGSREEARKVFPLIFTLVLFIALANQLALFPILFQITWDGVMITRQPTTSFAGTIALALIVIGAAHILALRVSPMGHISRFFPFHKFLRVRSVGDLFTASIEFFVAILEVIGEFAKILSLSARLFGNIFAGMVVGEMVRELVPFVAPIPFAGLEVFAGFVQVFVFMLLSIQFISSTVAHARGHEDHEEEHEHVEEGLAYESQVSDSYIYAE